MSPISRRPNFTKFAHNTSIGVAMKNFRNRILQIFAKNAKKLKKF